MSATLQTLATRTFANLHVEPGDDRHNRRQIGLILHDNAFVDEFFATARAMGRRRHVDGARDFLRGRRGPLTGFVAFLLAGPTASFLVDVAWKTRGLPMFAAQCFVELLAQLLILGSQLLVAFLELRIFALQIQARAAKHRQIAHDTAPKGCSGMNFKEVPIKGAWDYTRVQGKRTRFSKNPPNLLS